MALPISRPLVLVAALLLCGCTKQEMDDMPDFWRDAFGLPPKPTVHEQQTEAEREALKRMKVRSKPRKRTYRKTVKTEPYDPRNLIGQSGTDLQDLLGEPADQREEASGLVWSFRNRGCMLDLVLYSSVDGRDLRVLQYRVKGNSQEKDPDGALCVGRMVVDARNRQT